MQISNVKPNTLDDYNKWALRNLRWNNTANRYYDTVVSSMKTQFEQGSFWVNFLTNLSKLKQDYREKQGVELLYLGSNPELCTKPYESFVDKTFRKNVLKNENWPDAPNRGWVDFINGYEFIGDIVRTSCAARYLDGVELIVQCARDTCTHLGDSCRCDYKANDEGYYAVHVDIPVEFEIPTLTWESRKISTSVEIQVTTQFKDVIKELIHDVYAKGRSTVHSSDHKWQWDYKSDTFTMNYLGHLMHYLEGTIVELRDRRKGN